jgi:hypothetical protein
MRYTNALHGDAVRMLVARNTGLGARSAATPAGTRVQRLIAQGGPQTIQPGRTGLNKGEQSIILRQHRRCAIAGAGGVAG